MHKITGEWINKSTFKPHARSICSRVLVGEVSFAYLQVRLYIQYIFCTTIISVVILNKYKMNYKQHVIKKLMVLEKKNEYLKQLHTIYSKFPLLATIHLSRRSENSPIAA